MVEMNVTLVKTTGNAINEIRKLCRRIGEKHDMVTRSTLHFTRKSRKLLGERKIGLKSEDLPVAGPPYSRNLDQQVVALPIQAV